MNRQIRWNILALLLLLVACSGVQLVAQDTAETYQKYVETYKQYQDAISRQLPTAEINRASADFKAAKAAYESTLGQSANAKAADIDQKTVSAVDNDVANTTEATYQKYVETYKQYQDAVSRNLSKAEIDKA